jgi:predicted RNA-binding Zn-ribbon protein involved in translation (DUF1610 family)
MGVAMEDIPRVSCPSCGEHMKLRHIVPDDDRKAAMHFKCDCGFTYSMSARSKREFSAA